MGFLSDVLLLSAALLSALYCWVLARRLKKLNNMDNDLGAAIAALSAQVEEMRMALADVAQSADSRVEMLQSVTSQANRAADRLELTLAALHENEIAKTGIDPLDRATDVVGPRARPGGAGRSPGVPRIRPRSRRAVTEPQT